jgi:hypothetical protein
MPIPLLRKQDWLMPVSRLPNPIFETIINFVNMVKIVKTVKVTNVKI